MSPEQQRVNQIAQALEKLEGRIHVNPKDHPSQDAWKGRCREYRESLENFARYGEERPPSTRGKVKIDVPLKKFGIGGP